MAIYTCQVCNKIFNRFPSTRKSKYITCSCKCFGVIKSKLMKGKQPKYFVGGWNKGKKVWWSGKKHWNFKGKVKHYGGYVWKFVPTHPFRDKNNYVLEHRVVMENKIGRFLTPNESVHHINGVRDDNRIENLELFNKSSHSKLHDKFRIKDIHNRYV